MPTENNEKRIWWKEAVVYQIYPKSFCDTNGDGIGDLAGIQSKLDYLKALGVDVLWLSPIYPGPGFDNGYDISDYEDIDPQYGTMDDFCELLDQAHARGLRVVLDLVVNHTSDRHPWFIQSRAQPPTDKRDYYIWRPAKDGGPPNNWGALFGGPAWTHDRQNGLCYLHLFSPRQPDLNWNNEQLRHELYAMMRRWLDRGVDGFRMDVISLIAKPDDFADGPAGPNAFFDPRARIASNPRVHDYLREMRREVLSDYDIMTVGEASGVTLQDARHYTDPAGSELDMLFQFEHMDLDGGETFKWNDRAIPVAELKKVLVKWQVGLEGSGWNALFFNNHDQPRMVSRICGDESLHERAATMLATCLHMLKGTPFIYQGEELGMSNMDFTHAGQLRDIESVDAYRRYVEEEHRFASDIMLGYIRRKSRDNARTPMQWHSGPGAGFTDGVPWMDINPNYTAVNADEQQRRAGSVFHHYQALIALRRQYDVVVYGVFQAVAPDHPQVFAYTRALGGQKLFVACNLTDRPAVFPLPCPFDGPGAQPLLDNLPTADYRTTGQLAPYQAIIFYNETKGDEA